MTSWRCAAPRWCPCPRVRRPRARGHRRNRGTRGRTPSWARHRRRSVRRRRRRRGARREVTRNFSRRSTRRGRAGGRRGCARGSERTLDAGGIGFAGTRGQSQEAQASQAATGTREPKGKDQTRFPGRRPSRLTLGPNFLNPAGSPEDTPQGRAGKPRSAATPPVRMSGGLHTPSAHAQTLGAADLTSKVFGSVGPHVVGEMDGADVRGKGNGRRGRRAAGPDGTPLLVRSPAACTGERRPPREGGGTSRNTSTRPSTGAGSRLTGTDRGWSTSAWARRKIQQARLVGDSRGAGQAAEAVAPVSQERTHSSGAAPVAIRHRWHEQIQEQIRDGPPLAQRREGEERKGEGIRRWRREEGGRDGRRVHRGARGRRGKVLGGEGGEGFAEDDDEMTDAELKAELAKFVPKDCPSPCASAIASSSPATRGSLTSTSEPYSGGPGTRRCDCAGCSLIASSSARSSCETFTRASSRERRSGGSGGKQESTGGG